MGFATTNPATGEVLEEFHYATDAEVERAIERSHDAYGSWKLAEVSERAEVLRRVAEIYRERADELAAAVSTEVGKPMGEAHFEIGLVADIYEYYATNGPTFLQDEPLVVRSGGVAYLRRDPIGALLGVMPWNFPYYQVARFAAPNLLAGNTVLIKHAESCPRVARLIEQIFDQARLPGGAYVNLFAHVDQVPGVIEDVRIRGVSLTGSERAGAAVAEIAARNLKKCVLELGGSDPFVVLDGTDLDRTVEVAVTARMFNAGQTCTAAKRFIVLDETYDAFLERFVQGMEAIKPGDPRDPSTVLGPMSSVGAANEVLAQVQDAVDKGATVHCGGARGEGGPAFVLPTVLTGVTPRMRAFHEELFGPVAVVYKADSTEHAIELANDSAFGLSASVFAADTERAEAVAARLESGMVYINAMTLSEADLPFGGTKRSGFGRELGRLGIDEFVNKKLVRQPSAN